MVDRVSFGRVVSQVVGAGLPVGFEVALLNPILDRVETHVNCFASADLGGAVGDLPCRLGVVGQGSRTLRIAEFKESLVVNFRVLGVEKERGVGGFGRGADDGGNDGAGGADGTVDGGRLPESREDYGPASGESGRVGAGFWLAVVGLIRVDM